MLPLEHCDLRRQMGVNNLPKTVTQQRGGRESNSQPSNCESNALTTTLPSHPKSCEFRTCTITPARSKKLSDLKTRLSWVAAGGCIYHQWGLHEELPTDNPSFCDLNTLEKQVHHQNLMIGSNDRPLHNSQETLDRQFTACRDQIAQNDILEDIWVWALINSFQVRTVKYT